MTTRTYRVEGMSCQHCVDAVRTQVSALSGVTDVSVDLAAGVVTVGATEEIDHAAVAAAVDEAGYVLVP